MGPSADVFLYCIALKILGGINSGVVIEKLVTIILFYHREPFVLIWKRAGEEIPSHGFYGKGRQ